jgi:hypothetical protein
MHSHRKSVKTISLRADMTAISLNLLQHGHSVPFADPDHTADEASPIWSADAGAPVLIARADPVAAAAPSEEALFVPDLQSAVHLLIDDRKRNHLLLACGPLAFQLLVGGADLLSGPVRLNFIIRGIARINASIDKLAVLRKLLAPGCKRRLEPNGWSARTLKLRNALLALDGRAPRERATATSRVS